LFVVLLQVYLAVTQSLGRPVGTLNDVNSLQKVA